MRLFFIPAAILILSILLIACGSDSTTGPSEPGDWMPLTVGNSWHSTLDGYMLTTQGDTVEWSGSFDRAITALCQHQAGFQVYQMRTVEHVINTLPDTSWDTWDTMYVYLRQTDDEMQSYPDTISTYYSLLAQLPLTLGDWWYESADSTVIYEVTSLSASASVPAGNFSDCAIIKETDLGGSGDFTWETYLHRGTGIVYENMNQPNTLHLEASLQSYSVQ